MKVHALLAVVLALGLGQRAEAVIIAVSDPNVTVSEAAGLDLTESGPTSLFFRAYNENRSVGVATDTGQVDYLVGDNVNIGDTDIPGITAATGGPFLSAGRYDSHFVQFNPGVAATVAAPVTITFARDIVGIIVSGLNTDGSPSFLNVSDTIFGDPTTSYLGSDVARRLEPNDTFDIVAPNQIRLNDNFFVTGPVTDELRILTFAVVPLPPTALLLLGALGGVGLLARSRRTA